MLNLTKSSLLHSLNCTANEQSQQQTLQQVRTPTVHVDHPQTERKPTSLDPLQPDSVCRTQRDWQSSRSESECEVDEMDHCGAPLFSAELANPFVNFQRRGQDDAEQCTDDLTDEGDDIDELMAEKLSTFGWSRNLEGTLQRQPAREAEQAWGAARRHPSCRMCHIASQVQEVAAKNQSRTSAALFREYTRLAKLYAEGKVREAELFKELDMKDKIIAELHE